MAALGIVEPGDAGDGVPSLARLASQPLKKGSPQKSSTVRITLAGFSVTSPCLTGSALPGPRCRIASTRHWVALSHASAASLKAAGSTPASPETSRDVTAAVGRPSVPMNRASGNMRARPIARPVLSAVPSTQRPFVECGDRII